MLILSALALLAAQSIPAQDPSQRPPAEAFVAGLERVCPLYMKRDGLTPAEQAILAAELPERAGPLAGLPATRPVRLEGYPALCLMVLAADTGETLPEAEIRAVADRLNAWAPQSGWRPSSPDEQGRIHWTSPDGARELRITTEAEGVIVSMSVVGAVEQAQTPVDARRAAVRRPTDQALLEAIDSFCAVALTPAWSTVDQGEFTVRHSGNSRLAVHYVLNGDCTVRAEGDDAPDVAAALIARMQTSGSGWTLTQHAWMAPDPRTGRTPYGAEANFRHADGREVMVISAPTEVQAILWTGPR